MSVRERLTIVSGGQTGADRAALDFAIEHGISHGGWCPRGRRAEDGPIPSLYLLRETPSRHYSQRTQWNVRDSDATLIFSIVARLTGGTRLTVETARRLGTPALHLSREDSDSDIEAAASKLQRFLSEHKVERLNIAGPRSSQEPEVAAFVVNVLKLALAKNSGVVE